MPQKHKKPCFQEIVEGQFLLAVVAPISVQIIVERIELLTARQTIRTIAIIVDSLRHITKRSTRIKNNLIVILPPKQVSRLFSSLSDRTLVQRKMDLGARGLTSLQTMSCVFAVQVRGAQTPGPAGK